MSWSLTNVYLGMSARQGWPVSGWMRVHIPPLSRFTSIAAIASTRSMGLTAAQGSSVARKPSSCRPSGVTRHCLQCRHRQRK